MSRKGKPVAFPFYASDWATDRYVLEMPWSVQGMYVRLLCLAWQADAVLPKDPERIRRMAGVDRSEWPEAWEYLARHWPEDGDGRKNPKLWSVFLEKQAYREEQSRKGKLSAKMRREAALAECKVNRGSSPVATERQPKGQPKGQPNVNSPSPSPSPSPLPLPESRTLAGSPPRAARSVNGQPTEELFPGVALTKTGQPSTKKAGTPQAELVEHWAAEWEETRGVAWKATRQDFILAAKVLGLADGDLGEAKERASRMLRQGEDAWLAGNASLGLLAKRWNQSAVTVKARRKGRMTPEEILRGR